MNVLIPIAAAIALFALLGRWYSRHLAKMLGEDPNRTVPAIAKEDGDDYVPTSTPVVFAHHFASIAGAGPIVGPILALAYGWHWCWLWVVFGALFFGSVHDYFAMYMSVREEGATIVGLARKYMGKAGYTIFVVFVVTMLLIVNAVFLLYSASALRSMASIQDLHLPTTEAASAIFNLDATGQQARIGGIGSTSVIVITLFAPLIGWMYLKKKVNVWVCSTLAVILCIASVAVGFKLPVDLGYAKSFEALGPMFAWLDGLTLWIFLLAVYCLFAAGLPVWIFLQSRDFINVHILYAGLAVLLFGLISIGIQGGTTQMTMDPQPALQSHLAELHRQAAGTDPAAAAAAQKELATLVEPTAAVRARIEPDTQLDRSNPANALKAKAADDRLALMSVQQEKTGHAEEVLRFDFGSLAMLWPGLFITIACGAVSGFHSLCASGTASRQVTSEPAARQVSFYSMLLEGALAVMVIVAVTYAFSTADYAGRVYPNPVLGKIANPIIVFSMAVGRIGYDGLGIPMWLGTVFGMLMLEGFLVTTLDTAVRITRYLIEELLAIVLPGRKFNPWLTTSAVLVGTLLITFFGAPTELWKVFGTGNQLLAAFGLIVAALWLIKTGRNAIYALIPACIMLVTTVTMLSLSLMEYVQKSQFLLLLTAAFLLFLGASFLIAAIKAAIDRMRERAQATPAAP